MATILVCTRRGDMLAELAPLLWGEHRVAIVPHMADAVRSLLLSRFDAVALDLDEESVEGLEILSVVGQLDPRLPTVVVSGPLSPAAEAGIRAAGICGLLLRPLTPGELERHLTPILRWRSTEARGSPRQTEANAAAAR